MRITLAFVHDGEAAWLQSAYDEYTADEHNGVPDFHKEALAKVAGYEVREVVVEVSYPQIEALFEPAVIEATVVRT